MTLLYFLKVILHLLEFVALVIKIQDQEDYDKRISDIKANPRAVFESKFGRMRHANQENVPSSSPLIDSTDDDERDNVK